MANAALPITVGTVATKLTAPKGELSRDRDQTVVLRPQGGDIFVGGSGVTEAAGFPVLDGEVFAITSDGDLYGIAAADVVVRVLRGGIA